MLFNGNEINIFSVQYAFNRARTVLYKESRDPFYFHHNLNVLLDDIPENKADCLLSEVLPLEAGFWYSYPSNIAVIISKDDKTMLQTFSENTAGELYEDIYENEAEIRRFFEKTKDDVILMENKFTAKTIKPDYDSLKTYVELTTEVQKAVSKFQHRFYDLKRIQQDFDDIAKCYNSLGIEETFADYSEFIANVTNQFKALRNHFNDEKGLYIRNTLSPISEAEAEGIIFALYLYQHRFYKNEGEKKGRHNELIKDFAEFLENKPAAIDYFCKNLGCLKHNKEAIMAELEADGVTKYTSAALADEVLA